MGRSDDEGTSPDGATSPTGSSDANHNLRLNKDSVVSHVTDDLRVKVQLAAEQQSTGRGGSGSGGGSGRLLADPTALPSTEHNHQPIR